MQSNTEKRTKFLEKNSPIPAEREASPLALDGYKRLMAGVLIQAVIDATYGNWLDKLDAILWLASDEAEQYGELVGVCNPWKKFLTRKIHLTSDAPKSRWGWRISPRKNSKTKGYTVDKISD